MPRILTLALLVAGVFSAGSPAFACALRVGWEPWVPYAYTRDGVATGIDLEITRMVAAEMGCTASFHERPWSRLMQEIEAGQMDLAPSASLTPERESFAHFSRPYRQEVMVLVLAAGHPVPDQSVPLASLMEPGFAIGGVRDYHYGPDFAAMLADERYAGRISLVPSDEINVMKLANRRIAVAIIDRVVAKALVTRLRVEGAVTISPYEVHRAPIRIMASRQTVDGPMLQRINAAIEALQRSGKLEAALIRIDGDS